MEYIFEAQTLDEAHIKAHEIMEDYWSRTAGKGLDEYYEVHVVHSDHSVFNFHSAYIGYALWTPHDYALLVVFPEHHMPMVFNIVDLDWVELIEHRTIITKIVDDQKPTKQWHKVHPGVKNDKKFTVISGMHA